VRRRSTCAAGRADACLSGRSLQYATDQSARGGSDAWPCRASSPGRFRASLTQDKHRHERTGSSRATSKASISAQLAHALCPHGNSRTTSPVPGVPQLTSLPQYTQVCGSCIGTSLLMRSVTAPCLSIHRHVCQNVLVAHLYHAFPVGTIPTIKLGLADQQLV
jgi:hypothetical protein